MIMKSKNISIFLLLLTIFVAIDAQTWSVPYQWNYLEFQFPTTADKNSAIANRQYVQGNSFPIDMDVYNKVTPSMIFVTMPRIFEGTPFTLGTITGANAAGGPLIAPFPDYSWQSSRTCALKSFTSVFRVAVDDIHRLWVLDSGVINDIQTCKAKLVMFDLRSTSTAPIPPLIHEFPTNLYRNMSLFITPVVDLRNGYDSMVYIADVTGYGIIVFDYKNNKSWRMESQYNHLWPIQQYSNFVIAGESFNLPDGVFGLALSPKAYSTRQLFFHALASVAESRIPLSVLDNPTQLPITSSNQFVQMGVRQTTQTTAQAMDKDGNLFFGTIWPPGVGCWDSLTLYNNANLKLVARNDVTMQFISGLKIITDSYGVQEIWVLSCRFQKIMAGTRKQNEINYRIQKIPITSLIGAGKRCNGIAMP